jgi:hypothetical protein
MCAMMKLSGGRLQFDDAKRKDASRVCTSYRRYEALGLDDFSGLGLDD